MIILQRFRMVILLSLIIILLSVVVLISNNNSITGNVVNTRVTILPAPSSNCTFNLYSGWNLVSFYCIGAFASREDTLAPIASSYESIFSYEPSDVSDPWKSYNPNLPKWTVQQLTSMDRMSGYWIKMNDSAYYSISGFNKSTSISLNIGWNLVSYPTTSTVYINDSLRNVSFTMVKYYDTLSNKYYVYVNGSNVNDFDNFSVYKGYWLYSPSGGAWIIQ